MAKKPKEDTSPAPEMTTITVVAKQPSRWRAGLQFTSEEPRTVEVTDEQLELIEGDALLAIVPTPAPAETPAQS